VILQPKEDQFDLTTAYSHFHSGVFMNSEKQKEFLLTGTLQTNWEVSKNAKLVNCQEIAQKINEIVTHFEKNK
jgi:hypothetical protein